MALILKDRIKELTTTSGTGTYTLGGAETGFEAFSQIGNGNTTYYCCTDGADFEVGIGTYTLSGTTLARTTILQSSNSDAAVDWNAGSSRIIFCTQPAEKAVFLDASGNMTIGGTLGVTGVISGAGFTAGSAVLAEAELELLDGLTAGTAIASKVVTTDANIDSTGMRNLTISGELDAATGDFSGAVDIAGDLTLSAGADGALAFSAASSIKMVDNSATSLVIEEANTAYMTFDTANSGGEQVTMGKKLDMNGLELILDADADTSITADTDDQIDIRVAGTDQLTIKDGAMSPVTDSDIDLGTTSLRYKDAFIDTVTTTGNVIVGGDLTVTGDDITMGTNTAGHILVADGTNFNPTAVTDLVAIATVADGDTFLAVDASGGGLKKIARSALVAGLATSSAISEIVQDTTPQLGADLDTNSFNIKFDDDHGILDDAGNEQLIFQKIGSAVNQFEMTNAATDDGTTFLQGPILQAAGGDSNIDLNLLAKGNGVIAVRGNGASAAVQFNCESNSHGQLLIGQPHSASSKNTLRLPTHGADVTTTSDLVSTTIVQTLTNKTLTSPKINEDVAVTSTATELNALDGITAVVGELNALDLGSTAVGTAIASKAVILDSNKDYTGFRNITTTGVVTVGSQLIMPDVTSTKMLVADGTSYQEVAISGDITIANTGAVTIAATSVEGSMLNNNVISGQTALTSGLATTDELLVSDNGVLKRMDVSVLTAVTDASAADSAVALAIALG